MIVLNTEWGCGSASVLKVLHTLCLLDASASVIKFVENY